MSAPQPDAGGLGARVAKNALLNAGTFLLSAALAVVVSPFIVRRIGLEMYGLYGLATAILAPLSLANLGFGEATVKYVAKHAATEEWPQVEAYVQTTLALNTLVGSVGGALVFLLGPWVAMHLFKIAPENYGVVRSCVRLVGVGWLINQMTGTFAGIPAALQRYDRSSRGATLLNVVGSGLAVTFVALHGGVVGYTAATVLSSFLAGTYWFVESRRLLPKVTFRPRIHPEAFRSSLRFGGWQTISQIASLAANESERFILGTLLPPSAVGVFNIALSLEQRVYAAVFRVSEVMFPMFAAMDAESEERKASIVMRATWIITLIGVCALAPLVPLAHSILALWMTTEIADQGTTVLQGLALAGTFGSAANVIYFFLLGEGRTRALTVIAIVTGGVTAASALALLPRFGLAAAGGSILIAVLAQVFAMTWTVRRAFRNHLSLRRVLVGLYAPCVVASLLAVAATRLMPPWVTSWFRLALAYPLCAGIVMLAVIGTTAILPDGKQHVGDIAMLVRRVRQRLTGKPA